MNLRKIRLQLTALYAVLAALAVGLLAWIAISSGNDRILDSAEREAENVLRELAIDSFSSEPPNTWHVNVGDQWIDPDGDTWVEPPLFTIGDSALSNGGPIFADFEQEGPWIAYAEPINDSQEVLVAGRSLQPARAAMARQRDFIADAAHELRTSLAVIRASASHALSRERESVDYKQAFGEILAATERAGSGVGELLELARLDAGQAEPRKAPLRLDLLVEEVAASVKADGAEVTARANENIVVDADYALLRQVVENLTLNAVSRATEVELAVSRATDIVTIEVGDNGDGFDEDLLPFVFERFRRGDNRGSTGLGMAIAKSIIEAHGGSVSAANKTTGGAIVKLHLPAPQNL